MYAGKKIMQIVEDREKAKENLERCLNVLVCPECGYDLSVTSDKKTETFTCISSTCTFVYERDTPKKS